jgi:hypothetical protein
MIACDEYWPIRRSRLRGSAALIHKIRIAEIRRRLIREAASGGN